MSFTDGRRRRSGRARATLLVFGLALTGTMAATTGPTPAPEGVGTSTDGRRDEVVFVANAEDGTVSVIGTRHLRVVAEVDVLPDGPDATVGEDDSVQALAGQRVVEAAGGTNYAQDLDVSPDGQTLYVSRGHRGDVAALDLASGDLQWKTPVSGVRADHMTLSPDGRLLYVSALTADVVEVIDTTDGELVGSFPTGEWPHDNHFSADGELLYNASIGNITTPWELREARTSVSTGPPVGPYQLTVVDPETLEPIDQHGFERGIRPFVLTEDGTRMYAQLSELHGLVEYDLTSRGITRRLGLPIDDGVTEDDYDFEAPHHGLAISPDESTLCVAGRASDYAALVSITSFEATAIIDVGDAPSWAANDPSGRHCYLANNRDDTVSVVSYAAKREVARIPVGEGPKYLVSARVPAGLFAGTVDDGPPLPPEDPEFDGEPAEYASAFAAKELCSRTLIAQADPAPIIDDLRAASTLAPGFAIDTADIRIDREHRTVTVAHPGQPPRTAVHAESQGCVILPSWSGQLEFEPATLAWQGPSADEPWPLGERLWSGRSDIDRRLLDAALEGYIARDGVRALVVVHRGELVGERYEEGFGPFTPQRSWSSAKSLTGTLAGLLVDAGHLRLDDPVPVAQWRDDARADITLRQLLNMASGLKQDRFDGTERSLETFTPQNEHSFIYFDGFDTYTDALRQPLEVEPGTRFQYRNANVLTVAHIIRRTIGDQGSNPTTFPYRRLLEPLGMRSTTLETDPYGQFIASGTAFTTARDLARLGLLYQQGGRWAGSQLLSPQWVQFASSGSATNPGYSGFWWINHGQERFRSLPEDAFFASGAFGQNALVIPSHDLVIARMGTLFPDGDPEGFNAFATTVVEAVERGHG